MLTRFQCDFRPSTSTSGHRTTNSGSSENTILGPSNSTSVLDISANNKNVMWTPKYRNNSSGNPSSRGKKHLVLRMVYK